MSALNSSIWPGGAVIAGDTTVIEESAFERREAGSWVKVFAFPEARFIGGALGPYPMTVEWLNDHCSSGVCSATMWDDEDP